MFSRAEIHLWRSCCDERKRYQCKQNSTPGLCRSVHETPQGSWDLRRRRKIMLIYTERNRVWSLSGGRAAKKFLIIMIELCCTKAARARWVYSSREMSVVKHKVQYRTWLRYGLQFLDCSTIAQLKSRWQEPVWLEVVQSIRFRFAVSFRARRKFGPQDFGPEDRLHGPEYK